MGLTASAPTAEGPGRDSSRPRLSEIGLSAEQGAALLLAAGLVLIAFVTSGGDRLEPNTWTEIVLVVGGAGIAITLLLVGARAPLWGAASVGVFALLALLSAASITWSVAPDSSWSEANRTLSYLAVFGAGAMLARLCPRRWRTLLSAVAIATTVISAYALLVKVFPGTFDASDPFGRLRAPFDYWNATGLIAALGIAPCLWAGARTDARATRAFAVPAISVLLTVIVLSFSRGALLVALIALAVWFSTVPLRLRGAATLAVGAAAAAPAVVFALSTHALTHDQVALEPRTTAGHAFGIVLLFVLALGTAAGFLVAFTMDRARLAPALRRRIGVLLLSGVALIPVIAVIALASSSRGLTGEVSHTFSTLTNTNSGAANTPTRLVELGNTRGRYWSEGLTVGEHALLKGVGAFGYGAAVSRYTTDARVVPHAHSFVIQTFADFGLIGIAVILALLTAWAIAARRTLLAPDIRTRPNERAGLLTLLAVVITFGAHSAIDWTWFVPGTAIPALLCAGWLAGRGPDAEGVGLAPARRRLIDSPGLSAGAIAIIAVALACGWMMWQPLRAANGTAAALTAFGSGHTNAAIADARRAAAEDPVAVDPLLELAAIYTATGEREAALHELLSAADRQPQNAQTWLQLGEFELQEHRRHAALGALQRASRLDRGSIAIAQALSQARGSS